MSDVKVNCNPVPVQAPSLPKPSPNHVGALGERWNFSSDHLPVGVQCKIGPDSFQCVSWNLLNYRYMKYILEDNQQGLIGSQIQLGHQQMSGNLTLREADQVKMVQALLSEPKRVLALQECSDRFLAALSELFATRPWIKILSSSEELREDQGVVIFDSRHFSVDPDAVSRFYYPSERKYILAIPFQTISGTRFRLLNTHVPGGPERGERGRAALQTYVESLASEEPLVLLGDLNCEPETISNLIGPTGFQLAAPKYPTHINTKREAVVFDAIFYRSSMYSAVQAEAIPAAEFGTAAVIEAVALLKTP